MVYPRHSNKGSGLLIRPIHVCVMNAHLGTPRWSLRIKEIFNTHREPGVKIMTKPSRELLARAGAGHELGGGSNTNLAVRTGELMVGTWYRGVAGTQHRNVAGLLTVKIYILIILILIKIHIPTMGKTTSASPTPSSTLPTTLAGNMI